MQIKARDIKIVIIKTTDVEKQGKLLVVLWIFSQE